MSFRLPKRLPSKRASSFHAKKIVTPMHHLVEETELLLSRHQASTPHTTKSRAQSTAEVSSPMTGSRPTLHNYIFDTPKSKRIESKINESRIIYMSDLHQKFSPKPLPIKLNDDQIKLEEKLFSRVQQLTHENEVLKLKLSKLNEIKGHEIGQIKVLKDLKELKNLNKSMKNSIKKFIGKVRESVMKLCRIIESNQKDLQESVNAKSVFDDDLKIFAPFLNSDLIKSFTLSEHDGENTGRFRSLSDSDHSFSKCSVKLIPGEVIAMADYQSSHHGELSFKLGDRIQLIKTDDSDWWLGRLNDKIGRIPSKLMMLD